MNEIPEQLPVEELPVQEATFGPPAYRSFPIIDQMGRELNALNIIAQVMEELNDLERDRVAGYVFNRYGRRNG